MDNNALSKLTYGMYIISTEHEGKKAGFLVNTLTQVAETPDMVSVAVRKGSYTGSLIEKSRRFTASVLKNNADTEMIGLFGFKSSRDTDKFRDISYGTDKAGIPYVKQDTAAWLSCQVAESVDVGSHTLYIAKVTESDVLDNGELLTYSAYKDKKNAKSQGYRCTVCGYVYEGEELPSDFTCPWCNVGPEFFEKVSE